jgi:hypothetical protein
MNDIEEILRKAATPGFWGQVQVDYQDGVPVIVRKTETIKLRKDEDNKRHALQRST